MKKTALNNIHKDLGAKMVDFAGFDMPVSYSSISQEHLAVRNHAGIFDVSHMGEFLVSGPEAKKCVQYFTTNNVSKLIPGQAQYSCFPNEKGGIVDDLIVYRMPDNEQGHRRYMLVVNGSNIDKNWNWIQSRNTYDVELRNYSDEYSLLAIQGPKAKLWLSQFTNINLNDIAFYHYEIGTVADIQNVIVSNTGYTGSGGFELYLRNADAPLLWNALMSVADEYQAEPCGLGARDTLRLEMGYCLYGNDLTDETSPIEAGLSWIVKTKLKAPFIAKEIFKQQKSKGVERRLVGFVCDGRRVPRHGYSVYDSQENPIGHVTSGTSSPSLEKPIGMAYLNIDDAREGNHIQILAGKKFIQAKVMKPPFVDTSPK